jgi:hypothetical protein
MKTLNYGQKCIVCNCPDTLFFLTKVTYFVGNFTIIKIPLTLLLGLTCYTCDTDATGQKCIDSPDDYTRFDCTEGKDYCFTYRREDLNDGGEASKFF